MRYLISLAFLLSATSFATERGITVSLSTGQTLDLYGDSYALVIGVSDYSSGWPDLNSVTKENNEIAELLNEQGFSVTTVMNPDADSLEDAFEDFVDAYGYNPKNRLLFYFAGHGFTRKNNTKGYLVPSDAPNPIRDERGFLRKAYAMSDLLALARRVEAKHALFLFDSCFSGTIFKTRSLPEEPPLINTLTSMPVRQFITAGDSGQAVPAKSIFAPAFQDALRYGLADLNADSYVTGTELGMFLQNTVTNYSNGSQTPQYGKINDYELARGDFVFRSQKTFGASLPNLESGSSTQPILASEKGTSSSQPVTEASIMNDATDQINSSIEELDARKAAVEKARSILEWTRSLATTGAVSQAEITRLELDVRAAEMALDDLLKDWADRVSHTTAKKNVSIQIPIGQVEVVRTPTSNGRHISVRSTGNDMVQAFFSAPTWIEVTDSDGTLIFGDLQRASDHLEIVGTAPFQILLGNAVATQMTFNSKKVDIEKRTTSDGTATIRLGNK
jgi:hypothetical protein